MAASEVRVLSIIDQPGRYGFVYEFDGARQEWAVDSRETALRMAFEEPVMLTLGKVEDDGCIRLLFAYWRNRSADLRQTTLVVNKRFIVDFGHASPIRVL